MKRLLLFTFFYTICSAQTIVLEHYKISSTSGNFLGQLDSQDQFGNAVDCIGDLNNDGVNDFVISAQRDDDGGTDRGAVYILFMNEDGTVNSEQKISDTSGDFYGTLNDIDVFGSSVASMGDLNGDGINDIAVGAEYDGDGGYWSGAVWILMLNSDGTVSTYNKINESDLNINISGTPTFGSAMANIGDINGDGINDLAVGSRRDDDGGTRRGAVWILFLDSTGEVSNYQKISSTQGNLGYNLDFEDYFGRSVANLGDLNGDGINDIAVGAHRDDDGAPNSGAIYILFLNADGTVSESQKISSTQGNLNTTLSTDCFFGVSISTTGDLNGDCVNDILVGAPKQESIYGTTGAAFILYLNTDGTVNSLQEITPGELYFDAALNDDDLFGRSVAYISEYGDVKSLLIGASKDDDGGENQGAAWILKLKGAVEASCSEFYDDEGNCYNDIDLDGICDELEILGCTDEFACNYVAEATDEGECTYIEVSLFYDEPSQVIYFNTENNNNTIVEEWTINDNPVNTNTATIDVTQNGIYSLTVYDDYNNCYGNASIEITNFSISELKNHPILLYPNPTNGILKFNHSNQGEIIIISNLLGIELLTKKVKNEIDISELQPGTYIIQGNSFRRKIILQ